MEDGKQKSTINVLLDIGNYFGEHKGRMAPVLKFLAVAIAPIVLYFFMLSSLIKLRYILVFEVPWAVCWALEILGHGKEKVAEYKLQKKNKYASANELANIVQISQDGMIERPNGTIAYIIAAYSQTYIDDDVFALDMQEFLKELDKYNYDTYCNEVVDEDLLQNDLEAMTVYTDKDILQERVQFYIDQDTYCRENSTTFQILFLVKSNRYAWKDLRRELEGACGSQAAKVFKSCKVCNKQEVNDLISRDLCGDVDLKQILLGRYENDQYYGSQVLFYGDEIPEQYQPPKEDSDLRSRRVLYEEESI